MARRFVLPLLALLLVLIVGCTRGGDDFDPTPTGRSDIIFATFTPGTSGELPTMMPLPTAEPTPAIATMSSGELKTFIELHLLDGDPWSMVEELEEHGYRFWPGSVVQEDINGDENPEWIMTITPDFSYSEAVSPEGLFAIVEAPRLHRGWGARPEEVTPTPYRVVYSAPLLWGYGSPLPVVAVRDISADGREDVLFQTSSCGSAGCASHFSLLSYHGADTLRDLIGEDGDLSERGMRTIDHAEWSLRDWDGDGMRELLVRANIRGRGDAGPERGQVLIFRFEDEGPQMRWVGDALLPTSSRYFHLLDGEVLLRRGLFEKSIDLLDEVVHSFALEESGWNSAADGGYDDHYRDEVSDVRRFAYLRLMQAALLLGDRPLAASYHAELAEEWPEHPLTELAEYMLYAEPTDFWVACEKAATVAQEIPALTGALADMGWSNPPITGEHFCPVMGFDADPPLIPYIDYDPAILP